MNARFIFSLIISVCFQCSLFAQNPLEKVWDKRFGGTGDDEFTCFIQTADNGYLIGGWTNSESSFDKSQSLWGGYDYWIVKIDSSGNKQWDKSYGGTGFDVLEDVSQTVDGGYILAGWSNSDISGDKSQNSQNGSIDFWMVKIDAAGVIEWDKRLGGSDDEYLFSIKPTHDGGYALAGYTYSGIGGDKSQSSWGDADYWLVKIDSLGNLQWDKRYGGTQTDFCYSMQATTDGGYILGGTTSSSASGNITNASQGYADYWIVKTDSAGNIEWNKRYGGTEADEMNSLQQSKDGGYILGGVSGSPATGDKTQNAWGLFDYWIIKINASGTKEWDADLGGSNWDDYFGSVSQTKDGGYIASGTSYSPISGDKSESNLGLEQGWIVKTDSLGNEEWDKTILTEGHDEIAHALQTNDGCYVIAVDDTSGIGGYKSEDTHGGADYWLVKFRDTTNENQSVIPSFSASNNHICQNLCIDFLDQSLNNPISWQWFFPGGSPSYSDEKNPSGICYHSVGSYDVTLITENDFGIDTLTLDNYITVNGTPAFPVITDNDNVLTCSIANTYQWLFNEVTIPGATSQTFTATQTGIYSVVISNVNGCTNYSSINKTMVGIPSPQPDDGSVSVYPVPTNNVLNIEITIPSLINISIEIYNSVGQLVYSSAEEGYQGNYLLNISLANQSDGVYFLHLRIDDRLTVQKLILQRE